MLLNLWNKVVSFLQKDKKYLLGCAESAARFINEKGSGAFLNLLLDVIEISQNKFEDESRSKQYFWEVIYDNKGLKVNKLLGGGKTLSYTFRAFIEDFLQISKGKREYMIKNREFNELTLEELKYVLGWTRRLVEKKSGDKIQKADFASKNTTHKKRSKHNQNKELFNNSMASQLQKLFKNGNK